jgi:hypothetical protein
MVSTQCSLLLLVLFLQRFDNRSDLIVPIRWALWTCERRYLGVVVTPLLKGSPLTYNVTTGGERLCSEI